MGDHWLKKIYKMIAMSQEWKSSNVIPIYKLSDKQKVENYGGISLIHACYKIYSQIVNENLEAQSEMYPVNARMDSERQIFHRSIVYRKKKRI